MPKQTLSLTSTRRPYAPVQTVPRGESKTQQSDAKSCDIHAIMERYHKTGMITHVKNTQGEYLDMASKPEFKTAMDIIANATSLFAQIPSHLRNVFHNDIGEFLEFVQDENNYDQIEAYGFPTDHLPPRTPETPSPDVSDATPPPTSDNDQSTSKPSITE